jgi:hypothetical protein
MRLYRDADVPEDEQALLCRQSRLAGVVRFLVFAAALGVAPVLGWKFDHPWVLWIGFIVAAIVLPLMLVDMAALFRATNWLLRIGSDGVWINLRSYRDKVSDAASVVRLDYPEIASAGRHTESYSTPSRMATGPGSYGDVGGSTAWRDEFLEIQLNHDHTDELQTALKNLRHPAVPDQGQSWQVRSRHFPVWLVGPAVIRIGWVSAHGHAVLPRMAQALVRLDGSVRVAEPSQRDRPNWRKLTAEQVDELARELVFAHGATFEATALLVRAGRVPYAEANDRVLQFDQEGKTVR